MPPNFLAVSVEKVEVQGEICTVHMKGFSGTLTLRGGLNVFLAAYKEYTDVLKEEVGRMFQVAKNGKTLLIRVGACGKRNW